MTTPPEPPDQALQVTIGLADTPLGQRVAIIITALLPKDAAEQVADGIKTMAGKLSTTRLYVPSGQTPPPSPHTPN